jgi:GAF domain-containing protein
LKEILQTINDNVVKLFKVKGSSLLLLNKKRQTFDLVSSSGLSETYLSKGLIDATKSVPEVLESDQGVVIEEAQFDNHLQYPEAAREEGIRSILSIPLRVKEAVPGILRLYSAQPGSFQAATLPLLKKFADQAARAIENALAYAKVRQDLEELQQYVPK